MKKGLKFLIFEVIFQGQLDVSKIDFYAFYSDASVDRFEIVLTKSMLIFTNFHIEKANTLTL